MAKVSGGISNTTATFNQQGSTGILTGQNIPIPPTRFNANFSNGTATDQIDNLAPLLLTFTASTPQTIAMNALVDVQGNAISATRIRFIAFKNLSVVDNDYFLVGDAVTNEFDGFLSAAATLKIFPSSAGSVNDGFTILSAPGVTGIPIGSSNYNLKIDPGSLAKQLVVLIGTCSV